MLLRTIYLCGKVTGLPPAEVVAKFAEAEDYWLHNGCNVINPVTVVNNPEANWQDAMRMLLPMLAQAQGIYLLRDWQTSRGARLEILIADALGLDIMYQDIRQKSRVESYLNTYAWKGVAPAHTNTHCHCVTAAAKHRCSHNIDLVNCELNENDKAAQAGLRAEQQADDHAVHNGKTAFKALWASYESMLKETAQANPDFTTWFLEGNGLQHTDHKLPRIIEMHYGEVTPPWYEVVWNKIVTGIMVISCLPWIAYQFIRKPKDAAKLPFVD